MLPKLTRVALALSTIAAMTLNPDARLADSIRANQWHLRALKISEVQKLSTGRGVVVGVVDSGVSPHPDLIRNLMSGKSLGSLNGNGQDDQIGHGTEMAGLIGAHGRGENGVLGISRSAKILPVKISDTADRVDGIDIANGITWATENGASIINVSATGAPSIALNDALRTAAGSDALLVSASGNRPEFFSTGYPAAMPGVLAVGATDRNGKHAGFSVEGPQIQLCAPGVDIVSTHPDNKYFISDGTSSATAIVSGAAALVRSKFPELSAPEVIHRLTATATDIGPPGRDDECGFGELNILKALTADVPPLQLTPTASPPSEPPTAAATPTPAPAGANVPAIVGGVVGGLLVAGLVGFLAVRRRRGRGLRL